MRKIIPIAFVLVVAALYFGYSVFNPKPMPLPSATPNPAAMTTESTPVGTDSSPTTMKFTLDEVAKHADEDSCWMVLEGKVYDVTPFVKSGFHPGKDAILKGCGIDATTIFNERPNGSGSHSERARSNLPKYLIGELAP